MKVIFSIFLVLTLLISLRASEDDDPYAEALQLMRGLEIPKQFETVHGFNPVTYLEMFRDEEVMRFTTDTGGVSKENEVKLRALFLAADKASTLKYKQGYWINNKAPIVKLLAKVSPDVLKLKVEPGGSLHMFDIALTLEEDEKREREKSTGVSRPPDDEIGSFYSAEVPEDALSPAAQYVIRSNASNKFASIALPSIAKLISEENEDFLFALWWQHTDRSVRTSILAILLCRNNINSDAAIEGTTSADFEEFAERFTEPEAKLRKDEIRYVKDNFRTMAVNLARMTKGIQRVSKLFSAYSAAASSGSK